MVPRRRSRKRALSWLLVGLTALVLLGGLAFYRPFAARSHAGTLAGSTLDSTPPPAPPPPLPVKRTTFLVMGVDQREGDSGRADTMMVVAYDPETQQLSAVSIPRDIWFLIPGQGHDKVNHSYAYGGEKLAISTIQALIGIPIDHYVTVTFQDFAKIVDAVGGVEIDAEKRMEYVDPSDWAMGPDGLVIDIQPGLQKMDGITALKYSRFRADDEGDIGRVRRQQQVAKALMKAALSPSVWSRAPQIVSALGDAIDTSLSVADMLKLAMGGREALGKPLKTGVFQGEPQAIGGIFYLVPDLPAQRAAAYEVLVGTKPPDAYLARAREDQSAYSKALAEVQEADRQAAVVATSEGEEAPPPPQQPAPTKPPGTPATKPNTGGKVTKPVPITVAVVDASGGNVSADVVQKLKAAGFRVARVSKASKTVARTVAIDRAGQSGTEQRILQVLPTALVVSKPDKTAEEAVEIVLGQDLLPRTQAPAPKR